MKNTFGFIAIMGLLANLFNGLNPVTAIITVLCAIIWLAYPQDPSQRNIEKDRIQEEIWELEREQNRTLTSYSSSRQERIDKLTELLKKL